MNLNTNTKLPARTPQPQRIQIKARNYRAAMERLDAVVAKIPKIEDQYQMTTVQRINRMRLRLFGEIVPQ